MTPLLREFRIAYLRWALREIDPLHADVTHVVTTLRRLLDERAAGSPSIARRVWGWL